MPDITLVTVDRVRPLRLIVLRPGKDFSTTVLPGDSNPISFHFLYRLNGKEAGVVSFYQEDEENKSSTHSFRFRAMAVSSDFQSRGIGQELLGFGMSFILSNFSCKKIWCTARLEATDFYKKCGFKTVGEKFEVPDVGPHYVMEWIKGV